MTNRHKKFTKVAYTAKGMILVSLFVQVAAACGVKDEDIQFDLCDCWLWYDPAFFPDDLIVTIYTEYKKHEPRVSEFSELEKFKYLSYLLDHNLLKR